MVVVLAAISVESRESIGGPDPDISVPVADNICPNLICRKTIFSREVVEVEDREEFFLGGKELADEDSNDEQNSLHFTRPCLEGTERVNPPGPKREGCEGKVLEDN